MACEIAHRKTAFWSNGGGRAESIPGQRMFFPQVQAWESRSFMEVQTTGLVHTLGKKKKRWKKRF